MPPKETASTPASVVSAASGSPSAAAAFASRAPSTCRYMPSLMRGLGDRAGLLDRVDGAELGRLGDRDHPRLRLVLVAAPSLPARELAGVELAVAVGDGEQLRPGDALRRSALVDVHVGDVGADHRLLRSGQGVDRGDVGARAVEDAEGARVGAEVAAKDGLGALGPGVGAVGPGVTPIGGGDRRQDLGMDAGVVVGAEAAPGARRLGGTAHGCSGSRLPFIFAAASEQMKAIASAMSSAEVKVRNGFSGLSARICGVRIALTTSDVRGRRRLVGAQRIGQRQGPALGRRLGGRVGGVGSARALRLRGGDEDEAPVRALAEHLVESARRVLEGPNQQVVQPFVVSQRSAGERLATAPAADQVKQAVDALETTARGPRPTRRRRPRRAGRRRGRRPAPRGGRGR